MRGAVFLGKPDDSNHALKIATGSGSSLYTVGNPHESNEWILVAFNGSGLTRTETPLWMRKGFRASSKGRWGITTMNPPLQVISRVRRYGGVSVASYTACDRGLTRLGESAKPG